MILKRIFILIHIIPIYLYSQIDTNTVLIFDFNEQLIKENTERIKITPSDVSLVEDRFGNEKSAIYLHGNHTSYLNLGISPLLKPKKGTISLWVNLERKVYAGKGYESNPIIITKNSKALDFSDAYVLFYDFKSDRLMVFSSKDSTEQAGVNSLDNFVFNRWYHLAFTYDNLHLSFYINGNLQLRAKKRFETVFDKEDSVVIGNGASIKNDRYMRGMVDDIHIYHRVLSQAEINNLYNSPNPNSTKIILHGVLKYSIILFILGSFVIIIVFRNKKKLIKQREYYELKNKINELEIKVIKGQVNPHFISNCLSAVQGLIYQNQLDTAALYIAKFNYLMRCVLNASDKTYISLKDEIEIIKLNIALEQLRFKNEFNFKITCSDEIKLYDMSVPSLITQPIIENAIWHGLLPLKNRRTPRLNLNIFISVEFLMIEITDNGVGRLKKQYCEKNESKGIKLVSDKLKCINKLLNSLNNKMEIIDLIDDNNNQIGTKVILQIEYKHD